jgi:hypothetical protein
METKMNEILYGKGDFFSIDSRLRLQMFTRIYKDIFYVPPDSPDANFMMDFLALAMRKGNKMNIEKINKL